MYKSAVFAFLILFGLAASEVLRTFPTNVDLTACGSHPMCHYRGYNNWRHQGRAAASQTHQITIAVKLNDDAADTCDSMLNQISTPGNKLYGKFMSLEEVTKLTSNRAASKTVLKWLSDYEVTSVNFGTTRDFIKVAAPVAILEEMLQTEFHSFSSSKGNQVIRAASYSVPERVANSIDFIAGVSDFPSERPMRIVSPRSGDSGQVTPAFIKQLYNIDNDKVSNGASQSVFEAGQSFSPRDLKEFQKNNKLQFQDIKHVIGPNHPVECLVDANACIEANLDVEFMMGVAQNSNMTFWAVDPNSQDPFLDWVIQVGQEANPPLVHSISYGSTAPEDAPVDVHRFNTEICKFGLRGITVVVASGDDGVANYPARNDASKCGFVPSFPSACPYVTAVGATMGPESGNQEVACTSDNGGIITTGGGFSYWFPRPTYQDAAVSNYLKAGPHIPPLSMFNSSNRGYPDVAMLGFNYLIVNGGSEELVSGTSASAPVFAATITLINDQRIAMGKSPVGFLNPALYSFADNDVQVFNDITTGKNNCCASGDGNPVCCQYGFTATAGWDPLTGLGSINFKNLADQLVNM